MLVTKQPQFNLTSVSILSPLAGTWHVRAATGGPVQLQAQTLHAVKLIRTSPVTPTSSARHPLGARGVVTLRWSSLGLPNGISVAIIDSAHPGQIDSGRVVATHKGPNGSLRLGLGKLNHGGNYFALVATQAGVPFQRLTFAGSAWRR
jgi:hypothetical protein